jgi:hypothetical protein
MAGHGPASRVRLVALVGSSAGCAPTKKAVDSERAPSCRVNTGAMLSGHLRARSLD